METGDVVDAIGSGSARKQVLGFGVDGLGGKLVLGRVGGEAEGWGVVEASDEGSGKYPSMSANRLYPGSNLRHRQRTKLEADCQTAGAGAGDDPSLIGVRPAKRGGSSP